MRMRLIWRMPGKPVAEMCPQLITRNRVTRDMLIEYIEQGSRPLAFPIGKRTIEIPDQ